MCSAVVSYRHDAKKSFLFQGLNEDLSLLISAVRDKFQRKKILYCPFGCMGRTMDTFIK